MNTCRSPNLNEVDTHTPMPKPPSPHNIPSKENSSIAPSNHASPQHHSPPLIDPYVDVVLQVSDDEEVTEVKVLMALADDELFVGKNHARNGEWIDITIRKINIRLSMDEDSDWQNYLKYINIDLKTIDTTIDQQVAMDEALVPTTQRLRIGRSNFGLLSDIKSKESTLQLVYDVLRICPFFKAFLVTTDVPEIYMQEFKATTTDILRICPRIHGQSFAEPPFEKEIMAFIRFLGHSATIRTLTDVNINKLYQSWRSFAAIINKCLTVKSSGYDSLRLSHKSNVDYAYLMWKDFVYQVKHKNQKKSNEMYYPRFTKAIIHHFIHQNTQQFSALLPIELTNDEIKNSKAYKEYYAIATGEAAPKPKASVKRTRSSSDTSITHPTPATTKVLD
nr:hypothetical protein [Tanacetum cinerariifolium]